MDGVPVEIALRPATDNDFAFFRQLHRQAFRTYVEQTWGRWDEDEQLHRIRQAFRPVHGDIILLGDEHIGFLYVEDMCEYLCIDLIAILPMYQNRGIGTQLVRGMVATAEQRRIPVRLSVLKVNPARRLYERLGFHVSGGDDFRHFMERSPQLR